jgi:alpha-L-fucosidase
MATKVNPTPVARPTPEQLAWHDVDMSMFVHIAPDVWRSRFFPFKFVPPAKINPGKLDADQWARVALSLGAKRLVFIAKHERGFCWWHTETSNYGIKETPWKDGKGDVVAEVAASCKRHGLDLGIYLSPADKYLHARVGGACKTPVEQKRYNEVYRAQLTELLTLYGDVVEIWFDGSLVTDVHDILSAHAPRAIVFQGPQASIRWVGNEAGHAPYPAWNAVKQADAVTGISTAAQGDPDGDAWLPLEVDTTIRDHYWFWEPKTEGKLKSLEHLMEIYYRSVGHGCVLLLNSTPDRSGLIPECDVARAREFGAEIQRRFEQPIAETSGKGDVVTLSLPGPINIDHVITMEDLSQGERIREYVLEGFHDGQWTELVRGTAIGHKKIDFFASTSVSQVRFTALVFVGQPVIRKMAIYYVGITSAIDRAKIVLWDGLSAGKWNDLAKNKATTFQFKISSHCREARQYEIEIAAINASAGAPNLEVSEITLLDRGVPTEGFITSGKRPLHYALNITGFNQDLSLRLVLRKTLEGKAPGNVIIRRLA